MIRWLGKQRLQQSRASRELERYGMLALFASLVLSVGYLLEAVLPPGPPARAAQFRSLAAVDQWRTGPRAPGTVEFAPGGGAERAIQPSKEADPFDVAKARPVRTAGNGDFNFFEKPVVVPGSKPVEIPLPLTSGRTVKIRNGDTLAEIARQQYGQSREWRRILAANPGVDPRRLTPGETLVIPAVSKSPERPSSGRVYTVKKNDTFESIAQKVFKMRSRWIDIYEANRDRVKHPTKLQVGMVLRIPAE